MKDAVSALSVPEEVRKHSAILTVIGHQEVTVENHRGILAYETGKICIRAGKEVLAVEGKGMVIDYYNEEELKIVGVISQISWRTGETEKEKLQTNHRGGRA
jgi:sporulation protein YqfC